MSKPIGKLYNPPQRRGIGLLDKLPVFSSQEAFRLETLDESLSPSFMLAPPRLTGTPNQSLIHSPNHVNHVNHSVARIHRSTTSVAAPPTGANSSIVYDRTAAEINKYISDELAVVGTKDDGASTVGVQRLSIFKAAFRMLLPQMVPSVAQTLSRIMREYDDFMSSMEKKTESQTQRRERERLEQHYAKHFMEEVYIKEKQLETRESEFLVLESVMKNKLKVLEHTLSVTKEENKSLKTQQNEDSEKYTSMAQSVVESRLSGQKAEMAMHEMREQQAKVIQMEKNQKALMTDATAMYSLLKKHNIPFDQTCSYVLDVTARVESV